MSPYRRDLVHRADLVTLHRRLEGADRIDLGDHDPRALASQALRRALADVAESADHRDLPGNHDVGGPLDAVDQAFAASVEVVELRLRDRIVDVDGRGQKGAGLLHVVEALHAGGGLLRQTAHAVHQRRELLVHDRGQVAAVVEDHVRAPVPWTLDGAVDAPPELIFRLVLPREDRDAGRRHRRRGLILGGEDVARAPADLGAERGQGLDEHRGLDRHVQASGDPRPGERLLRAVVIPQRHQTGHLRLGDGDLLPSPSGEGRILDFEVFAGRHLSRFTGGSIVYPAPGPADAPSGAGNSFGS